MNDTAHAVLDFLAQNLSSILSAIAGFFAGFSVRVFIDKRKSITKSNQSHSFVGGDQAGRDINKK